MVLHLDICLITYLLKMQPQLILEQGKPSILWTFALNVYRNSFFPYCISQWNSLDRRIRNLPSIASFKRAILSYFRPSPAPIFRVDNHCSLDLLTRLRVGFSHLREHKFRHGFTDIVDPFCSCRDNEIETTEHYLLQCSNFSNDRLVLFDNLESI